MDWTVGGVAVASTAVATVAIANFAKWRVNCHFCNTNQWVAVKERRHFICDSCGQYNGFTEDGGYDRVIREQHRVITTNKRFVTAEGFQPGVSDSPFCARCEDVMERRRQATADWEPIDEDNWAAEYDEYRMRMERVYPLCERCEMNTQRRLTANKQRYKYLHNLKSHLLGLKANSIVSGLTSVSRMAARKVVSTSRRRFFSGGPLTTKLHLTSMTIAAFLLMTLIDALLSDCGMSSLPLPLRLREILNVTLLPHSFPLSIIVSVAHILSFATNKNRISLPDLVSIPFLFWLSHCLLAPIEGENALQAVASSSSLFLLLTAVAVLPRKRKHRKKPNYVINSAFSVASTPVSQVSSQADSFLPSPRDENWSPSREGVKTPFTNNTHFSGFREKNVINTPTDMEWEESEVCSPIPPTPQGRSMTGPSNRSPLSMRNGQLWREQRREETPDRGTPNRDIVMKMGAFTMRDENEEENENGGWTRRRRGGPFPSSSSHFGVGSTAGRMNGGGGGLYGGQMSRTPSVVSFHSRVPAIRSLATAKSTISESRHGLIPPSLARFHDRSSPTGTHSHSHLTSASQMNDSRGFYYLILILTFTSMCTSIGMMVLFYHTFFR